ncbi:hypothetical protein [Rhodococcus pyridinivorans]|nr:hypothetical protein [Rhodococcus pyridinivorans]MCD2139523.1 hypothetical protein [Rhodococcus pyridinivorans]
MASRSGMKLRLDRAGVRELLISQPVRAMVDGVAAQVAANLRSSLRPDIAETVQVSSYTSDRAAASVAICHPAGKGMQAKHGSLTRAAAAVGLEVRSR